MQESNGKKVENGVLLTEGSNSSLVLGKPVEKQQQMAKMDVGPK